MANKTRNQTKCPVCGRFTSENAVAAYEGKVASRETALSVALNGEQERTRKISELLDETRKKYDELTEENQHLLSEIHRLRSRKLWQRIWNAY